MFNTKFIKKLMRQNKIKNADRLSQQLATKEIFINGETIRNWLKGKSNPTMENIDSLATYFGVEDRNLFFAKKLDQTTLVSTRAA